MGRRVNPKPLELGEDWDWLIILDACRYDYFKKLWNKSRVEPRLSPGSCTLEFLDWMPRIPDSIVVTSHPFVLDRKDKFTEVVDAGFDDELNTCPPWFISRSLRNRYGHVLGYKHKILWFLQPHHPLIAEPRVDVGIFTNPRTRELTPQARTTLMYMKAKARGILSKAYEANLRIVLSELEKILPLMRGKIIITSDHGEGLGEPLRPQDKPVFSHPCAREEWEVRLVPFTVLTR
ncbi:MAG: hypothetical protein DRJ67_05155 [Thermoprotei archaeon]|nr:MAG: hypothetical protein DRJ67_05155 [Thermoprotei archaeon]